MDDLWDVIGISPEARLKKKSIVVSHVTALYQDMVKEIENDKIQLENEIEQYIEQLEELSSYLQCDISLPEEPTLMETKNKLQKKIEKYVL